MKTLIRRDDICSIGYYQNNTPGFPSEKSTYHWVQRCNFVFHTIGRVKSLQEHEFGVEDEYSGWMVKTTNIDGNSEVHKYIYIPNEAAASNSKLAKTFLNSIYGAICRIKSEDFWKFIENDVKKAPLKNCYISTQCGKICAKTDQPKTGEAYMWVFPNITLSSSGEKIKQEHIFVNKNILMKNTKHKKILPDIFPIPRAIDQVNTNSLKKLGKYLENYYGPRLPHALLVLSSALKAIHRDTLLKHEKQVSVMNVSGSPNIGKSFACAIALQLLGASNLMLSKCTASALLDHAHTFNNMLIVWDDPRDCSNSQLCSIVHEAFHGHSVSTISKGNRSYNSNVIIGTQKNLLGLQHTAENAPTLSRISHADFDYPTQNYQATSQHEHDLKKFTTQHDINSFGYIANNSTLNFTQINTIHEQLNKHQETQNIIPRAIRNLAIDYFFTKQIQHILHTNADLHTYFHKSQMQYLNTYANKENTFTTFCKHLKHTIQNYDIPTHFFKHTINVNTKQGTQPAIAIYPTEFFNFIQQIRTDINYTIAQIKHEIKQDPTKGFVHKNVAFKHNHATIVKRALVIFKATFAKVDKGDE